jgi:RNA polymerase sigma-54 factor
MALDLKQHLKLTQSLILTPQLQQAIKLLQLNRLELATLLREELLINPILEELSDVENEIKEEKINPREDEKLKYVKMENEGKDSFDWESYIQNYTYPVFSQGTTREDEEFASYDSSPIKRKTLSEHLLWQLNLSHHNELEHRVGELIIGNLNDDGYLMTTLEELAEKVNCSVSEIENILHKIQEFDPIGVGARDLKECLLIQTKNSKNSDVLKQIISNYLHELQIKNYKIIQKGLSINYTKVLELAKEISLLEPKPGRIFYDQDALYITPDVYIYRNKDEFIIALNEDGLPKLKISAFYKSVLNKELTSQHTKEYIIEKLKSAMWLIRGIHQRQRTIYKVVESIIKFQKDFLKHGVSHLKPMKLQDIASDIEMHESTISRVTSNKYIHTPQGVCPLKFFFSSDISANGDSQVASASIKERIKHIIGNENQKTPYSDAEIGELLKKNNVILSRRTVAKYRESIGLLPACKRKKLVI